MEDSFQEPLVSFNLVSPRTRTQVVGVDGSYLYSLS